jgi:hypothetical protein
VGPPTGRRISLRAELAAPTLPGRALYAEEMNSHEPNRLSVVPLRLTPLTAKRTAGFAVGATAAGRLAPEAKAGSGAASSPRPGPMQPPVAGPARPSVAREPLWRHIIGDVLRRERLAQERTLKDVADAARISMPYLSELERGRKEASSEVLAAAARALGLGLADLLVLAQAELARLTGEDGSVPARLPVPITGPIGGPVTAPAKDGRPTTRGPAPVRLEPSALASASASGPAKNSAKTSATTSAFPPASAECDSAAEANHVDSDAEAVAMAVSEIHGVAEMQSAAAVRGVQSGGASALLAAWRSTMSLVA